MKCPKCGHVMSKRKGKPWPAAKKAKFRAARSAALRAGASNTTAFKKAIAAVQGM